VGPPICIDTVDGFSLKIGGISVIQNMMIKYKAYILPSIHTNRFKKGA